MVTASALLIVIVGIAFAILFVTIADVRESTQLRRQTREGLVAADELATLLIDLETGLRGFVITGDDRFLEPWTTARAAFSQEAEALERLMANDSVQQARARRIGVGVASYIRDYGVPLIDAVRRHDGSAKSVAQTLEGKRRVDALRAEFNSLAATARADLNAREESATAATQRAIVAGAIAAAGSILIVILFTVYLTRVMVQPIRRAAHMADRIAGGDLSVRMPEGDLGEIGLLERSFNAMAGSLEVSRANLAASRARIVATADETRRRIERDLHDGAQQHLVSLALTLRGTASDMPPDLDRVRSELSEVASGLEGVLEDLREISRGIHPAILSEGGLGPALRTLARRSSVPVLLDVDVAGRLPEQVEVAAYYVVSEALTNAAKHARSSTVNVRVAVNGAALRLEIRDDGAGGADPTQGSGLIGLKDRVEAIGGTLVVESPRGKGTALSVELPLPTIRQH